MVVETSYWNKSYKSGEYQSKWNYELPSQELIGALACLQIPQNPYSLDLGCGSGTDVRYLSSIGFKAFGIDFSHEALKIAQNPGENSAGVYITSNVCALPFADSSFDLVSDRCCMHHISHELRPDFGKEIARVLKPGGFFILRGCRDLNREPFVPVNESEAQKHFPLDKFKHGPCLPVDLANSAGKLSANMIVLTRL